MKTAVALVSLLIACPISACAEEVVKVYVLAGQSNMEGKVQNKLLEHQSTDPKTAEQFSHWRNDDSWVTRDDVFIKFLGNHGGLSVGYGSRDRSGVELEFGHVVGEHHDQPVLLIKAAWGGHSLYKNFRPPSAGLPGEEHLAEELAKAVARTEKNNEKYNRDEKPPTMDEIKAIYGLSYRNMMEEVNGTLESMGELFPELDGRKPEIAGVVWHQGWNDQYNGYETAYADNMKHFVRDVRRDLGVPKLPFVIAVMGQNGSKEPKGAMLAIQQAQLAMEQVPEFAGNVKAVRTDVLIDKAAEALYPTWRKNIPEWEKTGSDHPYHYLGSAIWHLRMGKAFAEAQLAMEQVAEAK